MECRLLHHAVIGTTDLIVGQIVGFHVDDAILKNGGIDRDAFAAVARMGGDGYTTLGPFYDRARPRT
jgi:flavin reductase (DIM6/NTAB) family NADH-FMN oxidoreductase RutF